MWLHGRDAAVALLWFSFRAENVIKAPDSKRSADGGPIHRSMALPSSVYLPRRHIPWESSSGQSLPVPSTRPQTYQSSSGLIASMLQALQHQHTISHRDSDPRVSSICPIQSCHPLNSASDPRCLTFVQWCLGCPGLYQSKRMVDVKEFLRPRRLVGSLSRTENFSTSC